MNDIRNEIQSYYWHLYNIFENYRDEILYNENPEDVIIQLKPLGEYDSDYMEVNYNITNQDEFELFKSSKICNDYYTVETNYRLDNLKNDIAYIKKFIEDADKFKKEVIEYKNKIEKEGGNEDIYENLNLLCEKFESIVESLGEVITDLEELLNLSLDYGKYVNAMNHKFDEIKSYYWHLHNILKNKEEKSLYDNNILLKPLGEYTDYIRETFNIVTQTQYKIFKDSKIYNDYYNETNYSLDNLKKDMAHVKDIMKVVNELEENFEKQKCTLNQDSAFIDFKYLNELPGKFNEKFKEIKEIYSKIIGQ